MNYENSYTLKTFLLMRQTLLFALLFSLCTLHSFAQSFKMDKEEQREIVERLADLIRTRYIHTQYASTIADSLLWHYENQRYQKAKYDEELALLLNEDLLRLSKDKNLKVMPKFVEVVRINNDLKEKWIYKIFPSLRGKAAWKKTQSLLNQEKEKWFAESNYGLRAIQLLEGSIGYLRIDGFYDQKQAITNLKNALSFFKNTDYLILDLSNFTEGQPNALAKFVSYFVPKKTLLASFSEKIPAKGKGKNATIELAPLESTQTDFSLQEKQIYLLTSRQTGGCAELLIHLLKKYCPNIKLIGETTAGITNLTKEPKNSLEFVFGNGSSESVYVLQSDKSIIGTLEVNLPENELILPTSDTSWVGKGFTPDVLCTDTLVRFAHLYALRQKIKEEPDYNVRRVIDFQETLLAFKNISNTKKTNWETNTEQFLGNYEKGRQIVLKDNMLYLKRGENEWVKLIPIGNRTFLCETAYQSGFHFNNRLLPLFKIRISENKDKILKMTEIYADAMENRNIFLKIN
jgi:retinol-binding protein 3